MTAIKFTGDVTFLGPAKVRRGDCQRLPLYVPSLWLPERRRVVDPVPMGRNGRPRTKVTLPGHNAGVSPASKGKKYSPEPLTNEEALALLAVIPQTRYGRPWPIGIRNKALLALLWRTGLRISEALDLMPHHVDFQARRVKVMCGKNSKPRTVAIDAGGLLILQPWLFERATLGVGLDAPLFCTTQNPGKGNRLYSAYVRARLHEYARLAGIPKRVHPHLLRHTLAVQMIRERFPLADVSAQLGHADMATTCIYLRGLGADEAFERVAQREWPGVVA